MLLTSINALLNSMKSISPFPSVSIKSNMVCISLFSRSLSNFIMSSLNSQICRALSPDLSRSLKSQQIPHVLTLERRCMIRLVALLSIYSLQLMQVLKLSATQGCLYTYSHENLSFSSTCRQALMKSLAKSGILGLEGNTNGYVLILLSSSPSVLPTQGVVLQITQYNTIARLHKSLLDVQESLPNNCGLIYRGVPTLEFSISLLQLLSYLANPKSANLNTTSPPLLPIIMF